MSSAKRCGISSADTRAPASGDRRHVGFICTRQLPDATVIVFFPNEQNLVGLREVVSEIRASDARGKSIDLLFAASRLPRLDDEHGVLRGWLTKFQEELGYQDEQLSRIEHYDSLALLDQALRGLRPL